MADSSGRTERRQGPRRLTDAHLPNPEPAGSGNPTTRLRRAKLIAFLCVPALTLLAWTAFDLVDGPFLVPAALVLLATLAWFACLAPMLRHSSQRRMLADLLRLRTVRAVRRGLERDEFELHYQPQIDLHSGVPYGVEALLRWRRGDVLVPPGDFLPAVESSDLIGALTERVLAMALEQAAAWHRAGRSMRVAVNLSAANLRDHRVVGQLETLLAKTGVPADLLVLEVTETTVLESPEQTRAVLDAITELGIAISVDDFGIGYSSLLWLRIFPIEEVKIDRSFVSQLHGEGAAFVEGVIRLARDLSMRVVAEGIEEASILEELQALGCEAGQGFLFARPMPAGEVESWIDSHRETSWARRETTISIGPEYEEIERARDLVEERALQAGMSEADVWDVRVAVTEALANAIEHGPRAEDNLIHLRIAEERGELRLEIAGGGRVAGDVPPPRGPERGRGLSVMAGTMDSLKLTHDRDQNLIGLAKSLKKAAEISRP